METEAAPGPWNIADDLPCHQNDVIEEAARLMGWSAARRCAGRSFLVRGQPGFLSREPAGSEWQGAAGAGVEAVLSQLSGRVEKHSGRRRQKVKCEGHRPRAPFNVCVGASGSALRLACSAAGRRKPAAL
jgi:hypothetical protein